ncbi:MAG TPA: hypothetical protein VFV46_07330 [Lacibacter sp.]|nr:hypothetical protein [Lacibacter sp.]
MKLVFVATFLFFGLFVSAQNNNPLIETSTYSIQPPKGWTVDTSKTQGAELFLFSSLENKKDQFRENINLIVQNISSYGLSLDEYVKISEKQIQSEMLKDGVLISSERMHKDRRDFQKMIYTMSLGVFKLKILQYAFMVNGSAYVLTFTAEAATFDNYFPDAYKTMNTFTIKL